MRFLILLVALTCFGADRQVAITIDDLPRGGDHGGADYESIREMTTKLVDVFHDQKVPVTGFVNSGRTSMSPDELRRILFLWLGRGADLGNHTATHPSLNTTSVQDYESNIGEGETVLRAAVEKFGKKLEFFRYPFLQTGASAESKRAIAEFLQTRGYRNAPVTFDDADYDFARAYIDPKMRDRVKREFLPYLESVIAFFEQRSVEVVGREFPQILLLHASQMNADTMPETLAMFRRRGYRFVSLHEALRDDAYKLPENYVGAGGFSWIHRWSRAKGMANRGEPDEPQWLTEYLKSVQ